MKTFCCKCNHVLDIENEPDTGECAKCGGTMYMEGDVFDKDLTPSQQNTINLMADIKLRSSKKRTYLN